MKLVCRSLSVIYPSCRLYPAQAGERESLATTKGRRLFGSESRMASAKFPERDMAANPWAVTVRKHHAAATCAVDRPVSGVASRVASCTGCI